ncbi:MAG TPA: hypothetical protein VE988_08455 [Gemmataceae bacterium]|nr:hypothetical protein [Gemmataceae bacterium]
MAGDLNVQCDFPLVVGYFRQRSGEDVTVGQLTDLIAQTAPEELAQAVGPEVASAVSRDIASIRSVFADNVRISDVLTFLELRNTKVSEAAPPVLDEKWRRVEQGLRLVCGSLVWLIAFVAFLVFIAVLSLLFGLPSAERATFLIVVLVGFAVLMVPVFACYVSGQVNCCAIPAGSGARPAMILNAVLLCIGCSGICATVICIGINLGANSELKKPLPQQVADYLSTPELLLATIAIRIFFPAAHIVFMFGLIRMCEHLGHKGVALFGFIYLIAAVIVNMACFLLPFLLTDAMKQAAIAAQNAPPGSPPPNSVVLAGLLVIALVGFVLLACVLQVPFLIFVRCCRDSVTNMVENAEAHLSMMRHKQMYGASTAAQAHLDQP